jgi:hypothetical protein
MLVDLTLFLLALILGLVAAVLGRPKPPALDASRLLAVSWSALVWGQEEARDDAVARWNERVRSSLLYHPAARQGWAKLDDPAGYDIPVPSLPGERALVEALQALQPGLDRFERLFSEEQAHAALLDDPRALGEGYDPGRWLGHGCDWESLARWGEPVRAALARRLAHHSVVLIAAPDQLASARALLGGLEDDCRAALVELDSPAVDPQAAAALAERLRALCPEPSDRLALHALGDAGPALLEALIGDPILRDRVASVLLDGCPLAGVERDPPEGLSRADRELWLAERFGQDALDTELRRSTPYCLLARLEPTASPAGDGRIPWAWQRLDEPPIPHSGRRPVAVIELGAARADRGALEPVVQARGLLLLLAFLLGDGAPRPQ